MTNERARRIADPPAENAHVAFEENRSEKALPEPTTSPARELMDDNAEGVDRDVADSGTRTTSEPESRMQLLEALLFVAGEPTSTSTLGRALDLTPSQVRNGLDDLAQKLHRGTSGLRLQQGPDGAQLVTAPEVASAVEHFLGLEANRHLSDAALETLAIVAYRQPVTRHVIDRIRGVNSDGAISTLRRRGLIEGVGRAPGPGRPLLFSTTQRFLEHFGLERADELPPLPDDIALTTETQGPQLALGVTGSEEGAIPEKVVADDIEVSSSDISSEIVISGSLEDLSRAANSAFGTSFEPPEGAAIE